MIEVNLLGVSLAAVGAIVLGGLWYSPILFGNTWMQLSGITPESLESAKTRGVWKLYLGQFIFSLISAYVLAHFISLLGITTMSAMFSLAFWLWLGFQVTIHSSSLFWEAKPTKLFILNAVYSLVALVLMGIILVLVG